MLDPFNCMISLGKFKVLNQEKVLTPIGIYINNNNNKKPTQICFFIFKMKSFLPGS